MRELSPQHSVLSPLELLNLYYSDGHSTGNKDNKLWRKMNELLSWDNILNKGYQSDLCPLLYYILTKWLPAFSDKRSADSLSALSTQHLALSTQSSELSVPDSILLRLKKDYQMSLARNMILLDELERVLKAFNEAGIDVIVLKGAALAQTVYPDIALRPMGDVDLIVRQNDLRKPITSEQIEIAKGVLYRLNFYERQDLGNPKHAIFTKAFTNNQIVIELHTDIVSQQLILPIHLREIWAKSNNNYMYLPHLINYLCYHFMYHRFDRLIWIFDIAMLCKYYQNKINWEEVQDISKVWKLDSLLYFIMALLKDFFPYLDSYLVNDNFLYNTLKLKFSKYLFCSLQIKLYTDQNLKLIKHILRFMLLFDIKERFRYIRSKSISK